MLCFTFAVPGSLLSLSVNVTTQGSLSGLLYYSSMQHSVYSTGGTFHKLVIWLTGFNQESSCLTIRKNHVSVSSEKKWWTDF
jgi:hypothetical protein